MDMPGPDGSTQRAHLDIVEKATGQPQYDEPEVPAAGEFLWDIFWQLSRARGSSIDGASCLAHCELAAWRTLTATTLHPWEVQALTIMDSAYINASAAKRK